MKAHQSNNCNKYISTDHFSDMHKFINLRPSLYKYAIPSFTAASKFPFSAALVIRPKTTKQMRLDMEQQNVFTFPLI